MSAESKGGNSPTSRLSMDDIWGAECKAENGAKRRNSRGSRVRRQLLIVFAHWDGIITLGACSRYGIVLTRSARISAILLTFGPRDNDLMKK